MFHAVRLCTVLLAPFAALHAEQLVFAKPLIESHPSASDKTVEALFSFVNSGTTPVTITALRPSCGCTAAQLDKRRYEPGESAEIKAVLTIGDRTDLQVKTITVSTDVAGEQPIVLTMKVHLPAGPVFSSRFLDWPIGAADDARTLTITLPVVPAYRILRLDFNPKRLQATLAPGAAGQSFVITARPLSTATEMTEAIAVVTDEKTFYVFAGVHLR
jgi:hypothetical protein